ncbi:MAG: hypothetical protein B6D56_00020 [Candidatus Omnitrophica bacterium 4484_70.1]|nr:MAG: hypothetical protein B6D56_00020 [Candidatus Omnitrophica bacterium 4484_70.1]
MRRGIILALGLMLTFSLFSQTKKVVMIVAPSDFRDEELFVTKEVLESKGIEVKVASLEITSIRGMLGKEVVPDLKLADVNVDDFDGIIFVGGIGAKFYWRHPSALKIAQEAFKKKKVIAAICIAPVILANAQILKGKKATVWRSEAGRIKEKGAIYVETSLVRDGNIITASGPQAAEEFGEKIAEALLE